MTADQRDRARFEAFWIGTRKNLDTAKYFVLWMEDVQRYDISYVQQCWETWQSLSPNEKAEREEVAAKIKREGGK